MLALTRKKGESLVINNDIEITILEIRGDQIKLGVSAPKEADLPQGGLYADTAGEQEICGCTECTGSQGAVWIA